MDTVKSIVVLCGSGGAGKSSTLRSLIDAYRAMGASVAVSQPNSYNNKDLIVVLDFAGQRICVSTYGDQGKGISEGYKVAECYQCDVFVTASRFRDGNDSYRTIRDIAKERGIAPVLIGAARETDALFKALSDRVRLRTLLKCING